MNKEGKRRLLMHRTQPLSNPTKKSCYGERKSTHQKKCVLRQLSRGEARLTNRKDKEEGQQDRAVLVSKEGQCRQIMATHIDPITQHLPSIKPSATVISSASKLLTRERVLTALRNGSFSKPKVLPHFFSDNSRKSSSPLLGGSTRSARE
ncbi:unnamed protein product [Coffea canephora]|uniref:DH200=94 genomic scaffold, scaffold_269 n=1 Tax=Coffea canephora TaxID=49390 RepID=A0A068VDB5_COFCA|nr:unnamed protein product [Coffea canephora]